MMQLQLLDAVAESIGCEGASAKCWAGWQLESKLVHR